MARSPRGAHVRSIRPYLLAAGAIGGLLLFIGVVGALRMRSVEGDLRRADTLIRSAGDAIEQGRVGDAEGALSQAKIALISANNQLYGRPELEVLGWLPVFHDNLDSLRGSVALALRM